MFSACRSPRRHANSQYGSCSKEEECERRRLARQKATMMLQGYRGADPLGGPGPTTLPGHPHDQGFQLPPLLSPQRVGMTRLDAELMLARPPPASAPTAFIRQERLKLERHRRRLRGLSPEQRTTMNVSDQFPVLFNKSLDDTARVQKKAALQSHQAPFPSPKTDTILPPFLFKSEGRRAPQDSPPRSGKQQASKNNNNDNNNKQEEDEEEIIGPGASGRRFSTRSQRVKLAPPPPLKPVASLEKIKGHMEQRMHRTTTTPLQKSLLVNGAGSPPLLSPNQSVSVSGLLDVMNRAKRERERAYQVELRRLREEEERGLLHVETSLGFGISDSDIHRLSWMIPRQTSAQSHRSGVGEGGHVAGHGGRTSTPTSAFPSFTGIVTEGSAENQFNALHHNNSMSHNNTNNQSMPSLDPKSILIPTTVSPPLSSLATPTVTSPRNAGAGLPLPALSPSPDHHQQQLHGSNALRVSGGGGLSSPVAGFTAFQMEMNEQKLHSKSNHRRIMKGRARQLHAVVEEPGTPSMYSSVVSHPGGFTAAKQGGKDGLSAATAAPPAPPSSHTTTESRAVSVTPSATLSKEFIPGSAAVGAPHPGASMGSLGNPSYSEGYGFDFGFDYFYDDSVLTETLKRQRERLPPLVPCLPGRVLTMQQRDPETGVSLCSLPRSVSTSLSPTTTSPSRSRTRRRSQFACACCPPTEEMLEKAREEEERNRMRHQNPRYRCVNSILSTNRLTVKVRPIFHLQHQMFAWKHPDAVRKLADMSKRQRWKQDPLVLRDVYGKPTIEMARYQRLLFEEQERRLMIEKGEIKEFREKIFNPALHMLTDVAFDWVDPTAVVST